VVSEVGYEVDGAVATITLQRPAAMNSMSTAAKVELLAAVCEAGADDAVRAVVLTGAGDRAFCAGQDLRDLGHDSAGGPPDLGDTVLEHYNPIVLGLATMPKPVIAAVNGVAAGAGAAFALACDVRFAARSASFLMAFANIGLTGDSGISWTLQRIVGHARALTMLLLPERLDAERALELGMVNAVVPDEALMEATRELAARMAAGPTRAYAAIKQSVLHAASADLGSTLALEAELQRELGFSADHRDAVRSFLAKEPVVFTGH
jgi:2-(1,2-epoxy-1,2-dihydrophenyl)acetyl-CoA isomerase